MNEIIFLVIWICGIIILGILNFPLTFIIFNKFIDRGYAFSKSLFLVLISLSVWLFGFLKIIKIDYLVWIFFSLIILINTIIFLKRKKEINKFLKTNIKYIIISEILFIVIFLILIFIRSHYYGSVEKPHDMMLLNTIDRAAYIPPQDAWFSGQYLNYYYFGQFIGVMTMNIFFIPTNIGYNLFLVLIFTIASLSIFSLLFNLTQKKWVGILGILLFFSGNLFVYPQIIKGGFYNFDFFQSSRVMESTGTEFPFFSFLIGDLHAQITVFILSFLFFALLYNFYIKEKIMYYDLIIIGLVLGSIYIAHSWDIPGYMLLFLLVFLTKQINNKFNFKNIIKFIFFIIAFSVIFFLHYFNIKMPFDGIAFSALSTKVSQYLIHFGIFISFFSLVVLINIKKFLENIEKIGSFLKQYFLNMPLIIKPIILVVFIFIIFDILLLLFLSHKILVFILFLSLILSLFLYFIFLENQPFSFCIILFILAIILSITVEIVYINDFLVGIWERFNTVFRVYMQNWLLFTIAIAYFIYQIFIETKHKKFFKAVIFSIIIFSYFYPFLALNSDLKIEGLGLINFENKYLTIDGSKYLNEIYPNDYNAVNWLNKNIKGQPVILTKAGESYTLDSFVSSLTGLPTLIGWANHEFGYRGKLSSTEIKQRTVDADNIYQGNQVIELIKKYNIEYIYIGRLEKEKYPNNEFEHFEKIADLVYSNEDVKIYKVNKL